jgi:hypothetical protein
MRRRHAPLETLMSLVGAYDYDKAASQARLMELVRKAERRQAGIGDHYENARKLPLAEHIADFASHLSAKETRKTT